MYSVSEVENPAFRGLDDFLVLSHAIKRLVPDPADEVTRVGLVHVAFRKPVESAAPPDSISRAIRDVAGGNGAGKRGLDQDQARVTSLVLAVYAGDLPDPTGGACFAFSHTALIAPECQAKPVALLGQFIFFKTHPRIC